MKKVTPALLLGMIVVILTVSGCASVIGRGPLITKEEYVGEFSGVNVSHAFNVYITKSDRYRVEINTNENLLPFLVLENQGGILRLGFRSNVRLSHTTCEAYIEMPEIREIRFSGATRGELIGDWSMENLEVDMSGASRLKGRVVVDELKAELSGASNLSLAGRADRVDLSGSGASGFDMHDFTGSDATVHMSGASHATLTVYENLNAKLSGASSLKYRGNPKLSSLHTSGASSIHKF